MQPVLERDYVCSMCGSFRKFKSYFQRIGPFVSVLPAPIPTVKNSTVVRAVVEKMALACLSKENVIVEAWKHFQRPDTATPAHRYALALQRKPCLVFGNASMIMQEAGNLHTESRAKMLVSPADTHFQLQFGIKLLPVWVSCCCCVPSASMDQTCVRPPISRWKTMCRPSGAQKG